MYLQPNTVVPPSQKERRIAIEAPWGLCDFTIRPEDLQWQEPSRLSVQQTLGGAWVDAFGPGVAQITISGNTGWKRSPGWEAQFKQLHKVAFKGWHDHVEDTKDPENADMMFIDDLDARVVYVAPMVFTLKRNKAKPLLMQYTIQFLAVRDIVENPAAPASGGGIQTWGTPPATPEPTPENALASLINQIARAQAVVSALKNPSAGGLIGLLSQVSLDLATAVSGVMGVIAPGLELARSIVDPAGTTRGEGRIPQELSQVMEHSAAALSTSLGHVMAQVESSPPEDRAQILALASDMRIVACLFSDAFRLSRLMYPDYEPLYGASNCSSTSGGRPLSPLRDSNPFEVYAPATPRVVDVDVEALHAARDLAASDPVLNPWPVTRIADRLATIARGTAVAL